MIRHIALVALAALSLSTVACTAPVDGAVTGDAETTSDELVSRSAHFETFEGQDGQYYFNLIATNGQNVLRSEGYATLAAAKSGILSVYENGQETAQFEIKQADNGDWYFTIEAKNHEIIAVSEMYASKSNATRGASTARKLVQLAAKTAEGAPRAERFEIFKGEDKQVYFRLRAANGEIMLASQGYSTTQSAKGGIASVLENGTEGSQFEIAETADGNWVFRLVAGNGEIIARGESYATKYNAERAIVRLTEILRGDVKTTIHN